MIAKPLSSFVLASLIAISITIQAQEPGPPPPAPDYFPKTWKEFVSSEGGFRVRLPGAPKEETEVKPENILLHSLTYGSDRFIFYAVNYRDLANEKDAHDYLKSVRELRLLGMEGKMKLLLEKETTRDGQPAVLLDIELIPDRRLRELDIIRGRRHYNLIVTTFSNHRATGSTDAYGEIANSFLDSFHLIEGSVPAEQEIYLTYSQCQGS
jgi:hypothetical protein